MSQVLILFIYVVALCPIADAFWRMGCSKLEISRIDSIVQPQVVSNHVHTVVGGSSEHYRMILKGI
jgi:hypothetical protein